MTLDVSFSESNDIDVGFKDTVSLYGGAPGGYYTPSVDSNGNLTWAPSADYMPPIDGTNIKGNPGDPLQIDSTLTVSGKAADAKAAGDALNGKTVKTRIDFDGQNFTLNGEVLSYKQLHDIHLNKPDFAFVVYGDRAYLLSYVQDDESSMREMRWESSIATDTSVKTSGIYAISTNGVTISSVSVRDINSENQGNKVSEMTGTNENSTTNYPSNSAVSRYVSSKIDSTLTTTGKAADAKAAGDRIGKVEGIVSKPNLLDNPWLTVNQRDKTRYADSGYSLDRWYLQNNNETFVDVSGSGVTLHFGAGMWSGEFYQKLPSELRNELNGKIVTASVLLGNVNGITDLWFSGGDIRITPANSNSCVSVTYQYNAQHEERHGFFHSDTSESTIEIKAVKLEYGSVSTLANDHAPDYATELAKCQRYAIELNSLLSEYPSYGGSYAYDENTVFAYITLPVTPRRNGSITFSGNIVLKCGAEEHTVDYISTDQIMSNSIKVKVNASGLTPGKYYGLEGKDGTNLFISFDL